MAEVLSQDIADGVWQHRLPGYRVLGKRYGVSRPTCEDALKILERREVIGAARPREARKILEFPTKVSPASNRQLLIIGDTQRPMTPGEEELVGWISELWRRSGGDVMREAGHLQRHREPKTLLARWIRKAGADSILLYLPPVAWVEVAESSGLPCYALGGVFLASSGILSGSGLSVSKFLVEVVREAIKLAHRRILVVIRRVASKASMRESIAERIEHLLGDGANEQQVSVSVLTPDLPSPQDWHSWWSSVLVREQPTLVIVDSVYEAVSLHDHCLRHGIRMPQDLSMVVMEDTPILEWMNPPPTRYRFQNEKVMKYFRHWFQRGLAEGMIKVIRAKLVGGNTFGIASSEPRC